MIYAVLLCNKEWNIVKIKQNVSGLSLKPGDCLADVVQDADELTENDEKQYSLFLTFRENGMTLSTLVRSFQEGNLVILSHVRSDADFVEFNNEYLDFVEWVENHLEGFYHSEYFQIQKLNNQLIDSQRALIRSKRNLEMALEENKKINRKISEARQAAEQASRSKTQFLANMSHDIRTPMNAIVGLTKLMQYSLNDPETLDSYIQKLQSSSEYLLGLINDILDLSKIESGSIELKKESMNLRKVAEQIAAVIRPNVLSGGKKFRISEESFCHEHVLGDSIRIRQVLMNLLSNAVKYTPEGGEISLRVEELSSDKKYAKYRFTVEDTGIGMTEEFLQHIFEPFARAEMLESEIQGTGLGMAITKSIVDSMRGTIEVYSTIGKGSRERSGRQYGRNKRFDPQWHAFSLCGR
jgi:signal transduction histidine kinase